MPPRCCDPFCWRRACWAPRLPALGADALSPRPPELHRPGGGDRVLHDAPVRREGDLRRQGRRVDAEVVAALHQGEAAAAARDRVAAVSHRLGRRGHEGGVRAADQARHDVPDGAHRRRGTLRRRHARPQLLHVSRRARPRDDRGAERDAPRLHARASVQRRSGGDRGVVRETPGRDHAHEARYRPRLSRHSHRTVGVDAARRGDVSGSIPRRTSRRCTAGSGRAGPAMPPTAAARSITWRSAWTTWTRRSRG